MVEVIIFDLQEDGLAVHIVPWFQKVNHFGGDKDTVAVGGLHGNKAVMGYTQ